jgi:CRISPR/Cas system CSM-associated protein Csm2 small subunit
MISTNLNETEDQQGSVSRNAFEQTTSYEEKMNEERNKRQNILKTQKMKHIN